MDSTEDDAISVKVRGPQNFEKECFFFLEEILGIIDQVRRVNIDRKVYYDYVEYHYDIIMVQEIIF